MRTTFRAIVAASAIALIPAIAGPSLTTPAQAADEPALTVKTLVSGLDIPWDIAPLPQGRFLYTERARERVWLRGTHGSRTVVIQNSPGIWHSGETGIMGIEATSNFSTSREFMTCHGYKTSTTQDVRVVLWRLNSSFTAATRVRNLVTGLPSTTGRHAGCALLQTGSYSLFVGTGDAAQGTNPRNLNSGGGKILRVDWRTGRGYSTNPYITSSNVMRQRVISYGHRNVQGLARRANGTVWSVEHGSFRDDEVNIIHRTYDFGWHPIPGYNEEVPMTDHNLPGTQRDAAWSSGPTTIATSGAAFVRGSAWGSLNGALAVATLKGQSLRFMRFDAAGVFQDSYTAPELDGAFGRLRAVTMAPDGALYVTTSNGNGTDRILKVTPS